MNRHLVRLLLALYPRPWRDRYGTEVVRLTQDLIATGETTPARGALNMMGAALAERGRALADSRRTAVATAVAALLAVAGSFFATAHARPPGAPGAASSVSAPPAPARLVSCVIVFSAAPPGAKPGEFRWVTVAPRDALAVKGTNHCTVLIGRCRPGPAKPPGLAVHVMVKPDQCVLVSAGDKGAGQGP